MNTQGTARASTPTPASAADDYLNLVAAQGKVPDISRRIDGDFEKEVFARARFVANADPASLDIVSFGNSWTQVTETLAKSKAAVVSFKESLDTQIHQHPREIKAAATTRRDTLQAELDKRLEGDEALEKEIASLNQLIAATQPKQAGTKTAAAKMGKKTTKKAGTMRGGKAAKK